MEQNVVLRRVEKGDNNRLAAIIRAAFGEHGAPKEGTVYSDAATDDLFHLFREPKSVLWVAESAGGILGCCGVFPTPGLSPDTAELVKFYLLREARGRGTGKMLLQRCLESAGSLGYKKLYLESLPHYARAVGIYERAGFRMLDHPLGRSGHTACNIWMIKDL